MAECFYHPEEGKRLRRLRELQPEVFQAFVDFDRKVFTEGNLAVKTKELIAVAVAHTTQCPWCIDAHTKRAKKAGATEAEVAEVVFVAMALRAGAAWAHGSIALRAFED